jgi:hypothetical protein
MARKAKLLLIDCRCDFGSLAKEVKVLAYWFYCSSRLASTESSIVEGIISLVQLIT